MLLMELATPSAADGCLVDGFPRTVTQVEVLQLLHAKMADLARAGSASSPSTHDRIWRMRNSRCPLPHAALRPSPCLCRMRALSLSLSDARRFELV